MSAMEPFCLLADINPQQFSKLENNLLESEFFIRLYDKWKIIFKEKNEVYFHLLKLDREKEDEMLEQNFIRYLLNDIVLTENYSLMGIALYTYLPEEIIYNFVRGYNIQPSMIELRKIMELHRSIKPDLYKKLMKKIVSEIKKDETHN